jgi:hypothetical protein
MPISSNSNPDRGDASWQGQHGPAQAMSLTGTNAATLPPKMAGEDACFFPEGSSRERWIALLLFGVSCLYLRLFYDYTILNADEGIVLQGAQRILQGQVLYRDFFSFFTPGSYYSMTLLFRIFGSSILVARAALIVYGGLFSVLTYLLARRVSARWSALLACYAVTLTCLPFRFVALHNWDSTLLSYLTLYGAVRWLETGNWKSEKGKAKSGKGLIFDFRISSFDSFLWAFATGSFASLTFLFEHSKGAGLILGLGVGLLALHKSKIESRIRQRTEKIDPADSADVILSGATDLRISPFGGTSSAQSVGASPTAYCLLPSAYYLLAGLAWPFVGTFSYFAAHRALTPMLTDWAWPAFHYSQANRLPYGYLVMSTPDRGALWSGSWVERLATLLILGPCILLPILPLVALGVLIWFVLKRRRDSPQRAQRHRDMSAVRCPMSDVPPASDFGLRASDSYFLLVSAVLCGLLSSTFLTKRPDFTHLNYLAPLFYLVLAWLLDGLNVPSRLWLAVKPLVMFLAFLSYTAFATMLLLGPLGAHNKLQTARGTIRTGNPDSTVEYIQAHVTPGERIFVYPYQPLYYYLTATFSATRFDFLQPGMHTSDQLQESIAELEVNHPRVVLFEASFSEKIELAWPKTPVGVITAKDPVADYILAHYRPCRAVSASGFWQFVFMVHKGDSCPGT